MAKEVPGGKFAVEIPDHVALVTGASQGIGKAVALRLGAAGARVACAARNAEKLAQTVSEIRDAGGQAEAFPCDVTDSAAVDALVDSIVDKWQRLDILVNNAGITRDTLVPRMSDDDWDSVITTNLRSVFLVTRAATRVMMSQRYGRIINMSSVSGALIGNPGQANYSASKAGIIGLTKTVARELGGRRVTVNAVCPGFIASEMTDALGSAVLDEVKKRVPAKRLGEVEDIADTVLFLASSSASYITGTVITVDGGLTA